MSVQYYQEGIAHGCPSYWVYDVYSFMCVRLCSIIGVVGTHVRQLHTQEFCSGGGGFNKFS